MDTKPRQALLFKEQRALKFCEDEIARVECEIDNLKCVQRRLTVMPDKTSHQVMMPIGFHSQQKPPLILMPGHVKHTNEILCLLGDNWFVERSAKEAGEIADRRLLKLSDLVDKLKLEKKNHLQWIKSLEEMAEESSESHEIREEYDESKEMEWRARHRERMREAKLKERQQRQSSLTTDEDLMKRLEQLEMEEEQAENVLGQEEELFDWRREVAKRETLPEVKQGDTVKKNVRFDENVVVASSKDEEGGKQDTKVHLDTDLIDPIGSVIERENDMSAKPPQPPRGGRKSTKGPFNIKFNK